MGMSPSCHCLCPGTGGGSSGSGSGSGSGSVETIAIDTACSICSIAPARWGITLTASMFSYLGSARRNDCAELPGTYTLRVQAALSSPTGAAVCKFWQSDELLINTNKYTSDPGVVLVAPACPTIASSLHRVNLWLLGSLTNPSWYLRVAYGSGFAFGVPAFNWWNWSLAGTANADCVRSYTLNYTSAAIGADPTYGRNSPAADTQIIAPVA